MRSRAMTHALAILATLTAGCSGGGSSGGFAGGNGTATAGATLGPQPLTSEVDRTQAAPGDTVELRLSVPATAPSPDLYAVAFDVVYDPAVLEFTTLDPAGTFLANAQSHSALENGQAGRIVCVVSKEGAVPGEAGAGEVAVLRFTARATGTSSLGLEAVRLFDAAGAQYAAVLPASPAVSVP